MPQEGGQRFGDELDVGVGTQLAPLATAVVTKRRMCSRFLPITDRLNSSARSGWRTRSIANVVRSFASSPRR